VSCVGGLLYGHDEGDGEHWVSSYASAAVRAAADFYRDGDRDR